MAVRTEFHSLDQEPGLDDEILATLVPLESASAGAPEDVDETASPTGATIDRDQVVSSGVAPGGHVPETGLVTNDPDEVTSVWASTGARARELEAPALPDGHIALVGTHDLGATHDTGGTGSCRDEVDLERVEVEGDTATLVFVPSLREPCITPGGPHTVVVVVPATALDAELSRVRTEREL